MVKQQLKSYSLCNKNEVHQNIDGPHNSLDRNNLIGLEIEHFVLDDKGRSVFYENQNGFGIKEILKQLSKFYSNKIYSDFHGMKYLVGLASNDLEISIEPGAQLEVSIKAQSNIQKLNDVYAQFKKNINSVFAPYKYKLENIGVRPDKCALEVPLIPKNRYYFMDAYFKTVDTMGPIMMRNSASVQVSIDFLDKEDLKNKFKIASVLGPLIYFLYDNSPIFEKEHVFDKLNLSKNSKSLSGFNVPKRMSRFSIWNNTDACRCSLLKSFFDSDFDIDTYMEAVENSPLIYVPNELKNLKSADANNIYGDLFYPKLCLKKIVKNNCKLTDKEIEHILSMVFFDVRIKNFLELRCADSMPIDFALSYVALLKGIFYNQKCLDEMLGLFQDVKYNDFIEAEQNLQEESWDAIVYGFKAQDLFFKIIDCAKSGLEKQEQMFLEPTIQLIKAEKSLVEFNETIEKYSLFNNSNARFSPVSQTRNNTNFQRDYFLNNKGCNENRILASGVHINSDAIFEERVVDTAYFPKVYAAEQILQFESIVKTVYGIWEKLMNLYFEDERFRTLFKWDEFSERVINFRPKYNCAVPISRIDIFYDDTTGNFDVCEFNTGGTAAQSEVSNLCIDAKNYEPFSALEDMLISSNKKIKAWELYETWAKYFIDIYNDWAKNTGRPTAEKNKHKFTIAIVDFLENSQILDFQTFAIAFKKLGFYCIIEDIRNLEYVNGHLQNVNGQIINAVYKRATLNDVLPLKDDKGLANLIQAVFDDAVCPIDWFNTQIIHDKQISYILHDDYVQEHLRPQEVSFIKNHIPKTKRLTMDNYGDDFFEQNKNQLIIKPLNGRRSKDIFSGVDFNDNEWKEIIKQCAKEDNFIAQEFCPQYTSPNIELSVDNLTEFNVENFETLIKPVCNMEGLYCYAGDLSGVWLRQGDHSKSSTTYNITTPTFYTY